MRVGGQPHAPAAINPRERPGTNCIGGWVGPRASLEGCEKSRPDRDSIPGPSSPQRVVIPTELSRPLLNNWYRVYTEGKTAGPWRSPPPHLAPKLKKEYNYTSTLPLGLRCLF